MLIECGLYLFLFYNQIQCDIFEFEHEYFLYKFVCWFLWGHRVGILQMFSNYLLWKILQGFEKNNGFLITENSKIYTIECQSCLTSKESMYVYM